MTQDVFDSIVTQALQMPEKERALMAQKLISSLEEAEDLEAEIQWQQEVQRRLTEIDEGKVECISWEVVERRLRANAKPES